MIKDKEITSLIEHSQKCMNDCLDSLIKYFVDTVNNENSSRKEIIARAFEFEQDCIVFAQLQLRDMFLDGYKRGYNDALLEASGLTLKPKISSKKKKR